MLHLLRLTSAVNRFSRLIGKRRAIMQALAGVGALALGLWGWSIEEPPANFAGWTTNLFRTFQMITLQFPKSLDLEIPWQLHASRLLLPAVAALATFHVILAAITRPVRLVLMPHAHDHIVVCGPERFTEAALGGLAGDGRQIVMVDERMGAARRETLEGLGLTVAEADPSQPATFDALNLKRAAAVFLAYGTDLANIDLAMLALRQAAGRPASSPPLKLAVLIERDDLARELEATLEVAAQPRRIRFHRLNPDRDSLRLELATLAPAFRKVGEPQRSRALVVGLSGDWDQILMQLVISMQDYPEEPPVITLLLDGSEQKLFDAWRAEMPDIALVAALEVAARGPLLLPPETELCGLTAVPPHLVVILRPDVDGIATALALRRPGNALGLTDQPILVRRDTEDRILARLEGGGGPGGRIAAFGGLVRQEAIERILDDKSEESAKVLHERYREAARSRFESSVAGAVPWDELPETLRDANRAAADHAPILRLFASDGESFSAALVEQLARVEHRRWMADRIDRGWRSGPQRNDARRVHPSIRPYDELDDGEREKDRSAALALLALPASAPRRTH